MTDCSKVVPIATRMLRTLSVMLCCLSPAVLALNDTRASSCPSDDILLNAELPDCGGSCASKCGESQLKSKTNFCSCDHLCLVFKDCCPDFTLECPQQLKEFKEMTQRLGTPSVSCESLKIRKEEAYVGKTFNLVSYCKTSEMSCEFDLKSVRSIMKHGSPVLDTDSGLYFVNSACASCYNIQPQSLVALQVTISCGGDNVHTPVNGHEMESAPEFQLQTNVVVQEFIENRTCYPSFTFLSTPRACVKSIHSCPESCEENNITRLCHDSMQGYVKDKDELVNYYNIYCALCNNFLHSQCGSYDVLAPVTLGSFSLALLFDIRDSVTAELSTLTVECTRWVMYPVQGMRCMETICSDGYVYTHGTCVKLQATETVIEVYTLYFVDVSYTNHCPKLPQVTSNSLQQYIWHSMADGFQKSFNVSDVTLNIILQHVCNITSNYTIESTVYFRSMQRHENVTGYVEHIILSELTRFFVENFLNDSGIVSSLTITSGNTSLVYFNDSSWTCNRLESTGAIHEETIKNLNESHIQGWRHGGKFNTTNSHLVHCLQMHDSPIPTVSNGLGLTTIVVTVLSLVGLGCRISLQLFYPPYHTAPCRLHCCLACNLAVSNILLLTSPLSNDFNHLCYAMGMMKYLLFLNSFCLMTCIAWDNWHILRCSNAAVKRDFHRSAPKYLAVSSAPVVIMGLIVIGMKYADIETKYLPDLGGPVCWFTNKYAVLIYFVIPVSVCVVLNFVFFALTGHALRRAFSATANIKSTSTRRNAVVYVRLFLLMGVTWMTLFFTIWVDSEIIWYIFVVSNGSQGIYLSIAFAPDIKWIKSSVSKICRCNQALHAWIGAVGVVVNLTTSDIMSCLTWAL